MAKIEAKNPQGRPHTNLGPQMCNKQKLAETKISKRPINRDSTHRGLQAETAVLEVRVAQSMQQAETLAAAVAEMRQRLSGTLRCQAGLRAQLKSLASVTIPPPSLSPPSEISDEEMARAYGLL